MQKLVFTNGGGQTIDLTSGNFGITNWEGLSGVGLNIQVQQVPFQDGGVFLDALMEQREISVTVAIQDNNDLSARYERKRQLISALNPKLGEGVLVYTNDYLSRQIKAVPQLPIFENKNSNDAGTLKASVVFSCPSPYWEDLEDIVVNIEGTETVINNGDVPCQVQANLYSNINSPILYNKRNQKKIALDNVQNGSININTNIGQKEVNSINTNDISFIMSGQIRDVCCLQDRNIYVGNIYFEENILTGEKKILDLQGREIYKITYSEEKKLYVAVGWYSILISSDGIHWALQLNNTNYYFNNIEYIKELELFIATGAKVRNGVIMTSADGITWTERLLLSTVATSIRAVAYSPDINLAIAVGEYNTHYISSDGLNWTGQSDTMGTLKQIKYIDTYKAFIAVGQKSSQGCICKSTDGSSWEITTLDNVTDVLDIEYFVSQSIFVGVATNNKIVTSENFADWEVQTETKIGQSLRYNETCNCFISVGSNTIFISNNGTDWNDKWEASISTQKCVYSKKLGLFVAVGQGVIISRDGIEWEKKSAISNLRDITYSEDKELFVAVGYTTTTNGIIYTSIDGNTWASVDITLDKGLNGVTYSEDKELFVAVGIDGIIITSTDGITWTRRTTPIENAIYRVTYSEDKELFVAVGYCILTSTDGLTWNNLTIPSGVYYQSVIYSNIKKMFIAVGSSNTTNKGIISTSKDGVTWIQTQEQGRVLYDVIFIPTEGIYIAVGYKYEESITSGIYLVSYNGIDWTVFNISISNPIYGICYSEIHKKCIMTGPSLLQIITQKENIIDSLSPDSDMTFNLEKGQNEISFYGGNDSFCVLSYRQKYIGV